MSDPSSLLADKIALVTGASRGIGYEIALGLAKAGAQVVATARTEGGLEALDDAILAATGRHATLVPHNIEDGEGLDRLGAALYERFGRLDILVSNAGDLGLLTPVAHLDPEVFERACAVNLTATYRLIRSVDPLLRAAPAARALFMTSGVVKHPRAFWGAYCATKSGMEALVRCYADEMETTRVRCTLLNPGQMRTRMLMAAFPGKDPDELTPPEAIVPFVLESLRTEAPPLEADFPTWREQQGGGDHTA